LSNEALTEFDLHQGSQKRDLYLCRVSGCNPSLSTTSYFVFYFYTVLCSGSAPAAYFYIRFGRFPSHALYKSKILVICFALLDSPLAPAAYVYIRLSRFPSFSSPKEKILTKSCLLWSLYITLVV